MIDDLLTDLLRETGLRRRLLGRHTVPPDAVLQFPCDRSIGLHLAVRGPVHVHAPGLEAPLVLDTGDVALMARGCTHALSTRADIPSSTRSRPGPCFARPSCRGWGPLRWPAA
jgi:hypothetical protein